VDSPDTPNKPRASRSGLIAEADQPFVDWLCQRWGGSSWQEAVENHCRQLLHETDNNKGPISLARVAARLGIDPRPEANKEVTTGGWLDLARGRIVLPEGSDRRLSPRYGRARFTYAHELGHAMLYSFEKLPAVRLAPPCGELEEILCNHAASHLLMPRDVLMQELGGETVPSADLLRLVKERFEVSAVSAAIALHEVLSPHQKAGSFHMLSSLTGKHKTLGETKPRCVVCFLPPELREKGIEFLPSFKGLEHISRVANGQEYKTWSLVEFFSGRRGGYFPKPTTYNEVLVIPKPKRRVFHLQSSHRPFDSHSVWTSGTIALLGEDERIQA